MDIRFVFTEKEEFDLDVKRSVCRRLGYSDKDIYLAGAQAIIAENAEFAKDRVVSTKTLIRYLKKDLDLEIERTDIWLWRKSAKWVEGVDYFIIHGEGKNTVFYDIDRVMPFILRKHLSNLAKKGDLTPKQQKLLEKAQKSETKRKGALVKAEEGEDEGPRVRDITGGHPFGPQF